MEREDVHLCVRICKSSPRGARGELCAQHVLAKPPARCLANNGESHIQTLGIELGLDGLKQATFFSGESRPTYPILTMAFGPRRRAGVKTSVLTPRDMTNVGCRSRLENPGQLMIRREHHCGIL